MQCTKKIESEKPKVIKKISGSTQLEIKFFLLINVKMPTSVGNLMLMNRKKKAFLAYLSLKNAEFLDMFILMSSYNLVLS